MTDTFLKELKVFYCYAREDQDLQEKLERYLAHLKRRYRFSTWFDRQINPGDNWERTIEVHLNSADLFLLLISPDFMASDYCYNKEMQCALERHSGGEAQLVPILLRPTYWREAPFSNIQMLPTNGVPLTRWPDLDEAFQDIIVAIDRTVQALLGIREIKAESLEEGYSQKNVQRYNDKKKAHIDISGQVQGTIVNIGGQTDIQGDVTIRFQNMQQSKEKLLEDDYQADI